MVACTPYPGLQGQGWSDAGLTQALRTHILQPLHVADGESPNPSRLLAALNVHSCYSLETRSKLRFARTELRNAEGPGPRRSQDSVLRPLGSRCEKRLCAKRGCLIYASALAQSLPWQPGEPEHGPEPGRSL